MASLLPAALAALALGLADAQARPNLDLATAAPPAPPTPVASGIAVAREPGRGAPSLLWTPNAAPAPASLSPADAARLYLERYASSYGVGRGALAGLRVLFVHDTGRGGIVVALRQTVAGVDLFHADIKLLLDRAGRLVAIAGTPHPAAVAGAAPAFVMSPEAAIAAALRDLYGDGGAARLLAAGERDGWRRYGLAARGRLRFREPARARPVYFPRGEALVPAHFVEVQASLGDGVDVDVYQFIVAADDGRLLYRRDATAHDAFQYRVWADPTGDRRPLDSPRIDTNPHPTGVPGEAPEESTAPALVTMEGFNQNPEGEVDPWLPAGATETRGNNVDAYLDHEELEPPPEDRQRATITGPDAFDRVYDPGAEPTATVEQSLAAVTQVFYLANWMHDWWYDSGFTEAAGNAQQDNLGRGGVAGDPLLAEAQDGAKVGKRNNASMSTPADGGSPRMELLLFTPTVANAGIDVTPPGDAFPARVGLFGPKNFDLTAPLVAVVDAGGVSPSDACEAITSDVSGAVALIDRGQCSFELKVHAAQAAGAVGAIVVDNVEAGAPPTLGNDAQVEDPTLPTLATTKAAGAAMKAALAADEATAHIHAETSVERDSSLENMMAAHEWGHYMHHRLVECGSPACRAESEAWGDFNALMMTLREGDDLGGVYVMNTYANLDPTGYFGVRRVPYSVDTTRNALSFRHIGDGAALPDHPVQAGGWPNSEVHNAGEVWATMMWEVYVALHVAHAGDMSFDAVRRRMSDYVVAGMMLAPPDPTFTEQRDALLMAAAATSPDDFTTIAEAFARRGAGSCATSPPRYSQDFVGVVEDFELRARGALLSATIGDATRSCDGDGVIDVGELGRVDIAVWNGGVAPLPAGTKVEVVAPDPRLVFPDGPAVALPELAPLEATEVAIAVAVDPELAAPTPVTLTLRLSAPQGCEPASEIVLPTALHADVAPAVSASDDVETTATAWTPAGEHAAQVWSRVGAADGHHWHAADIAEGTDTSLVSPPLQVARDADLIVAFAHAYSFDYFSGNGWDGAVIELSSDDGASWFDIAELTQETGYNGQISSASNPLSGRDGFIGTSPGFPTRMPWSANLGTQLAGQTVRLRFRLATNLVYSAAGWDIDDLEFSGLTNTPFPRWTVDAGLCAPGEETTGGEETGAAPTTGAAPEPTQGDPTAASSSSDAPEDDTATSGAPVGSDAGCGCVAGEGGALPWLALLGLRRRRKMS